MTAATYATWQQWRTCGRKMRYATQIEANTAVLHVWKRGGWLWPYECDYCHGWHTTSHTLRETA